jgi:hypothetical protein
MDIWQHFQMPTPQLSRRSDPPTRPVTRPTPVFNNNGCFLGPMVKFYPTNADTGGRYTRTAEYYDKGVLTPLTIRTITDVDSTYGATIYDQITLPATNDDHWYLDQPNKYPLPAGHAGTGWQSGRRDAVA